MGVDMRRTDKALVSSLVMLSMMALAACSPPGPSGNNTPGDPLDDLPYAGIAPGETVRFTGTEPFWGGEVRGTSLLWKTPEMPAGERITVARFAGRNGISYTGKLRGEAFGMAVTPWKCSDGMSGRSHPFTVTVRLSPQGEGELLSGCAWTDARGFSVPPGP